MSARQGRLTGAPERVASVGVATPGLMDIPAGVILDPPNLKPWRNVPVRDHVARAFGKPTAFQNDANAAAMGEFWAGAGRGARSMVLFTLGTGVGGGIVIDGKVLEGRHSHGAELGHIIIETSRPRRCGCGRLGCLEAYAGRGSMERKARRLVEQGDRHTDLFEIMEKRGRTRLTSGVWARALDRNDKLATHLIDQAVEALGAGIASAVNLLDVEAVIIGGGLGTRLGQPYVQRIRDAMMPHLFVDERPPAIHLAALGDLGGAIGAALVARKAGAG